MAHIEDLAVELMFLVFKHIYSYRRDIQDLRHPATFPFNVVWVCQSWRQMLMGSPEYWTHIAFDVSNDPTPLLDAFAWSTDLKISVLVFTTANDLTDEGKMQENCRVASIVTHLQPHIERCTSIVFDITFASSLPSSTIFSHEKCPISRI
ncbi:hypothetical protein BDZ97DRAFT_1920478 [Flammula alnicola]|nr:hypothetical protein BDZ97DRAFT_1920478 [Flammula alnicola]